MLKDVVNIIKDISLRHKGVSTFRYQSEILNNAQNNNKMYQVYVDDVSLHELNITTNISANKSSSPTSTILPPIKNEICNNSSIACSFLPRLVKTAKSFSIRPPFFG